jgi:ubiquinone/menaquinone biosynthesis C-methylase UbiE
MTTQKSVWDAIAPEWFKFKDIPSQENKNFVQKQKGKLLDLGSGAGRNFVKTKADIYALDFSEEMIKYAKKRAERLKIKNIKFFVAPTTKLPFENNSFDAVLCTDVLHCIPTKTSRTKTLKEIYRVLKPKAKTRLVVWNKESTRFKNKKKQDYIQWRDKGKRHYYFYTENELENELEKIGFKIISQTSTSKGKPHHSIAFIVEK